MQTPQQLKLPLLKLHISSLNPPPLLFIWILMIIEYIYLTFKHSTIFKMITGSIMYYLSNKALIKNLVGFIIIFKRIRSFKLLLFLILSKIS